jgi:uncharacterized protein YndB with AHSA1/START domain
MRSAIDIHAPINLVWDALTSPALMSAWMSDEAIEVITDWKVGHPISIRGRLHGIGFENKGTVLHCEYEKRISYSHLSSLSRLPDLAGNYSIIDFTLAPMTQHASVNLDLSNFPTEVIRKHLEFYWRTALVSLKRFLEDDPNKIRA